MYRWVGEPQWVETEVGKILDSAFEAASSEISDALAIVRRGMDGARREASRVWALPRGDLRDVGLRVRVVGEGRPTFLLLHGLGGSNRYFGAAFDSLGEEGRLLAPDLLGFGGSPRPDDGEYGPDAHAQAVLDALDALQVNAPVYVGAHSIGTLVALRLARRRPDLVRGIVAFGPPLYRTAEEARVHLARLGLWVRLFAMDTVWARWVCTWMCAHRRTAARVAEWLRPDLPPEIARDGVEHSWFSYSGSFRNLVLGAQGEPDLGLARTPVVLVAGDRDDVVDLWYLRHVGSAYPGVRLEVWPGGHDLPLQDPERCMQALHALAKLP